MPKEKKLACKVKPSSKKKPQEPGPSSSQAYPNWPVFKPQLPVTFLTLDTLVPDKVMVTRNFWPKSLCRDFVSFLKELPLTTTPGKPRRGEAIRVNDRFQIDDFAFASRLWKETGLKDLVLSDEYAHLWDGQVIGLNPNIRVYRYSKSQFFDCHYDDYNLLTLPRMPEDPPGTDNPISAKTTWTLLLYLTSASEGCVGGETVFHPNDRPLAREEIAVAPETGMLLLHKHGDDCMLHEGREVLSGEKWVLRSDLCVKR